MPKKQLTVKGTTVQFALETGLRRLGLEKSQAVVKVLQKESRGVLGSKGAVIAIVYDEEESNDAIQERTTKEFREKFEFIFEEEKAKIKVPDIFYNPKYMATDDERKEFLYKFLKEKGIEKPDESGIQQILLDPQAQDNFVTVKKLEVIPIGDTGGSIFLKISPDKLECQAIIFHGGEIEEDDVFKVLKDNQIIKGIMRKNLNAVLENKYCNFFLLAKGSPPSNDMPAPLEFFFQEDERKEFAAMMEQLTIDTRSVKDINIADRNQLLMRLGEVEEGRDGYAIDGSLMRKKEIAQTMTIKTGQNVYFSDDGKEVFSSKAGHIVWKASERFIDIEPVYIVDGNVDFSEGNIMGFAGKVVVKGDVRPKFSVIAEGDIEIHGSVEDAVVESTKGNIYIGGSVIHQNEGYIQGKGIVHSAIASNANIRGEIIDIEKEVMNSTLEAQDTIQVTGTPGVIVGGITKAKKIIRANIVGSENWVPTKIQAGDVSDMKKRQRTLSQQLVKKSTQLKEAHEITKILQERMKTQKLSEVQQEQLDQATEDIANLEDDMVYDTEEEARLKKEIEDRKNAHLEVFKTLFPQVDLYIFDAYFLPAIQEEFSGYKCRDGLIVRYPLG